MEHTNPTMSHNSDMSSNAVADSAYDDEEYNVMGDGDDEYMNDSENYENNEISGDEEGFVDREEEMQEGEEFDNPDNEDSNEIGNNMQDEFSQDPTRNISMNEVISTYN
jgi:hypothetical protein